MYWCTAIIIIQISSSSAGPSNSNSGEEMTPLKKDELERQKSGNYTVSTGCTTSTGTATLRGKNLWKLLLNMVHKSDVPVITRVYRSSHF